MASRSKPVWLNLGATGSVVCASQRKYAAVQLVWDPVRIKYRPKVVARSDTAKRMSDAVRKLKGWSFVFELRHGHMLWENTPTEWHSLEEAIYNHEVRNTL